MSCLVYCILRTPPSPALSARHAPLSGVDGQGLRLVAAGSLSAVVSEVEGTHLTADVPRLRAYAAVVETLHARFTVVPMRFGSLLEEEAHVRAALSARQAHFQTLLDDLDGCAEMGIRLLLPAPRCLPPATQCPPPASGRAYLANRGACFAWQSRMDEESRRVADGVWNCLDGLALRRHEEMDPGARGCLLSLCSLVPKASVALFREAARRAGAELGVGLLVSGPWPPYSFV